MMCLFFLIIFPFSAFCSLGDLSRMFVLKLVIWGDMESCGNKEGEVSSGGDQKIDPVETQCGSFFSTCLMCKRL